MNERKRGAWRWRVSDPEKNPKLNLLYEPGNWGDVLKGTWAAVAARDLVRAGRLSRLRYLDPYAGAPSYPLAGAATARLEKLPPGGIFSELEEPFARRGEIASTALLVKAAAEREGAAVDLQVFDADPERRRAWEACAGATILPLASGEEALGAVGAGRLVADFILVDPYDLLEGWPRLLPSALKSARRAPLLLYLHNKSPRSAGFQRQYTELRRSLEKGLNDEGARLSALLGRIPSDPSLARAYHEVILLAPEGGGGRDGGEGLLPALRRELREATCALARSLAEAGAFEEIC